VRLAAEAGTAAANMSKMTASTTDKRLLPISDSLSEMTEYWVVS
jgi:hypothetical protein